MTGFRRFGPGNFRRAYRGGGLAPFSWPASTVWAYDYAHRTVTGSSVDTLEPIVGSVALSSTGTNRPTLVTGPDAIQYDGTDDYLRADYVTPFMPANTPSSDMIWVAKFNSQSGVQQRINLTGAAIAGVTSYFLYTSNTTVLGNASLDVGGVPTLVQTSAVHSDTTDYHVWRVSVRSDGIRTYRNGSLHAQNLTANNGNYYAHERIGSGSFNWQATQWGSHNLRACALLIAASAAEIAAIEAYLLSVLP